MRPCHMANPAGFGAWHLQMPGSAKRWCSALLPTTSIGLPPTLVAKPPITTIYFPSTSYPIIVHYDHKLEFCHHPHLSPSTYFRPPLKHHRWCWLHLPQCYSPKPTTNPRLCHSTGLHGLSSSPRLSTSLLILPLHRAPPVNSILPPASSRWPLPPWPLPNYQPLHHRSLSASLPLRHVGHFTSDLLARSWKHTHSHCWLLCFGPIGLI